MQLKYVYLIVSNMGVTPPKKIKIKYILHEGKRT